MADKVITSTGDCSACCEPPADCSCALLIPPFEPWPYADYATAAAAIADQVSGCLGYFGPGGDGGAGNSISAAFDGTTISADQDSAFSGVVPSLSNTTYISVSALSSAVLSCVYTTSTDGTPITVSVDLLDCSDGSSVDSDSSASGSGTLTVTVPADGEYVLYFQITTDEPTYLNSTWDVTSSSAFWVNPVIALWDDSGTTRQLEACPKMLLPPLTEASGDWWTDCANAALAISGQSADCLVYNEYPYISMSAVDSGTGVNLDAVMEMFNPPIMWVSLNLEAGETLTAAYTASVGAVSVTIFDYEGNEVETLLGVSPLTSAALPYTGRYIVRATGAGDFPVGTTVSVDYTSSGAISANQIQSLYNIALDCPARLNCGDACP